MGRRTRRIALAAAGTATGVALVVGPALAASAHPAETSGVFVTVHDDAVDLQLQLPIDRLSLGTGLDLAYTDDLGAALASVRQNEDVIDAYLLENIALADADGTFDLTVGQASVAMVDEAPTLVVDVEAEPDDGIVDGDLTLDYGVIIDTVAAHDVYVALVSDWGDGQLAEGEPDVVAVLDHDTTSVVLDRDGASWWTGMTATIRLGIQHIADGTDHLLFLLTLLLAAPLVATRARHGWRWGEPRGIRSTLARTGLIVSAFTVGHTVSLALVSLGVVSLSTTPVELLVAGSIVVAAAHAVKPLVPRGEILVAGLFGLVHGTAFATTILDLRLNTGATVASILGFNLGVEVAQLIAVALALPLVLLLSRTRAYPGVRLVLAVGAGAASVAWVVGIVTATDSVLTPVFAAIAARPVLVYGAVVVASVIVWALATRVGRAAEDPGDRAPVAEAPVAEVSPVAARSAG